MIQAIGNIVERACNQDANVFGYTFWSHHIIPVVKYANMLAKKLGADEEVVEIAALLHDYAGICDVELHKDHHVHGARMAEELLKTYDYPQEKIEMVKKCILCHRGSVVKKKDTPEQECVASADAMAHIDQAFSIFLFRCKFRGLNIDESITWLNAKIERSWAKLCPEAKDMISERYVSLKSLLEMFSK
jgi:uncharacterized protein